MFEPDDHPTFAQTLQGTTSLAGVRLMAVCLEVEALELDEGSVKAMEVAERWLKERVT